MLSLIEKKREKIYLFYEYFMEITLYNFLYQRLRNLSTNENLWLNISCLKKVLDLRKKHLKCKIYVRKKSLITFYINLRLNIFLYFKIYKRVLKFSKQFLTVEKSLMKFLVVF